MVLRRIAEPINDLFFIRTFFKKEKWQFVRKIGSGSYGTAYLIQDPSGKQLYILKRLNFHKLKSNQARAGFQIETQLLSELSDVAFPALVQKGSLNGTPYFIMEYKAGKTFEQLIFAEGKVFSEHESFTITARLLSKLAGLHQMGIVHRDLRIPNVLADGERLSIIDFGLARKLGQEEEGIEADNPRKRVHFTSDLYSLGHFLLFLLYSGYQPSMKKERTWEEELELFPDSKRIIKKLLMSDVPYSSSMEALADINKQIKKYWE
ncbi:serine/threonine protein kinase [Peribacillus glennii]|uniref:Serine/threonine protein kinase n=1 Tax=Peribacillus glennii TaxID=2303991 RepID=A0A372LH85_9BACI|nr:protein kinase [Peribacillus glennii]RFU65429.1 serine/threonine protein kinase [Peribacillus glennii]